MSKKKQRPALQEEFQRECLEGLHLPVPEPLDEAVKHGVFGIVIAGVVHPTVEQVEAITVEHACEMLDLLLEIKRLHDCARNAISNVTGKGLTMGKYAAGIEILKQDADQLAERYQTMVSLYERGFGKQAAKQLDRVIREVVPIDLKAEFPTAIVPLQREMF